MISVPYPIDNIDGILEWARGRIEEDSEGKVILDAVFFNATPALVGGWRGDLRGAIRGHYLLPEPPRPTDIAGKLRWWARVAILSALIDDPLNPEKDENILRITYRDIDEAIVKHLFGYISRAGAQSSIVKVRVEPIAILAFNMPKLSCLYERVKNSKDECEGVAVDAKSLLEKAESHDNLYVVADDHIDYTKWAVCAARLRRVKLRTLRGKTPEDKAAVIPLPPGSYIFRLRVELDEDRLNRSQLNEDLALHLLQTSLYLFLTFSGIGGMINRGYGKLGILREDKPANLSNKELYCARDIIEKLKEAKNALYKFISNVQAEQHATSLEGKYKYVNFYVGTILTDSMMCCINVEIGKTWHIIEKFESITRYNLYKKYTGCEKPIIAFILEFPRPPPRTKQYRIMKARLNSNILNRMPSLVRLVTCKIPTFSEHNVRLTTAGLFVKYLGESSCYTPGKINRCVVCAVQIINRHLNRAEYV